MHDKTHSPVASYIAIINITYNYCQEYTIKGINIFIM